MKNKNNKNAKKPLDQVASSWLQVRVTTSEKSRWVKNAQRAGLNLSQWVTARLNNKL